MDDQKLIDAVKGFPSLWQATSEEYKSNKAKKEAWESISSEFGETVEECMKKWKALRDRFVRELKKTKAGTSSDEAPYVPSWKLFNEFLFLQDSIRHKRIRSSKFNVKAEPGLADSDGDLSSNEEDDVGVSAGWVRPPSAKRSRAGRSGELINEASLLRSLREAQARSGRRQVRVADEEELFGQHIATVLRRLNPRQKAQARVCIEQALVSAEFPEESTS